MPHHQKVPKAHHPSAELQRPHSKQHDGYTTSSRRAGGTRYPTKGDSLYHHRKAIIASFELVRSSKSRKHSLAKFVLEQLNWTSCSQSLLHWTLNGMIVRGIFYKPPPTRLQTSDLQMFPHFSIYVDEFNSPHTDWGCNSNSANRNAWVHKQTLTI